MNDSQDSDLFIIDHAFLHYFNIILDNYPRMTKVALASFLCLAYFLGVLAILTPGQTRYIKSFDTPTIVLWWKHSHRCPLIAKEASNTLSRIIGRQEI